MARGGFSQVLILCPGPERLRWELTSEIPVGSLSDQVFTPLAIFLGILEYTLAPPDLSSLLSTSSLSRVMAFSPRQTWYLFSLPGIKSPLAHTTSFTWANATQSSGLSLDITSFKNPSLWVPTSKLPEDQPSHLYHLASTWARDAVTYKTYNVHHVHGPVFYINDTVCLSSLPVRL